MAEIGGITGRGGPGPFGGEVAMKGQGGFQALPEPTMVSTPKPKPAPMRRPMARPGASNPYGPAQIRPENMGGRVATRSAAAQMMLGRGGARRF